MIHPYKLIGMPYRLGASPERHGAADCLTLAKATLAWHGIATPDAKRSWYRRLKRGDTDVFKEELERWGEIILSPSIGTVALCQSNYGLGMASYFEEGWIHFNESAANWSPIGVLQVVACYCPMKSTFAKP